ncbi:hypothetical protein [Moorena producens]|nr:hypothetical protein [Moorena producens]
MSPRQVIGIAVEAKLRTYLFSLLPAPCSLLPAPCSLLPLNQNTMS